MMFAESEKQVILSKMMEQLRSEQGFFGDLVEITFSMYEEFL